MNQSGTAASASGRAAQARSSETAPAIIATTGPIVARNICAAVLQES